jgi:hypothetical protein
MGTMNGKPKSAWRNPKSYLLMVAGLVVLIGLFYAAEGWRGRHAWEQFKREWEAKGEKFDRASVVPAPVPEDRNFALAPVVASSYETFLDRDGHAVQPRNTNVINRLQMNICSDRAPPEYPTNGDWRLARTCDLSAWQRYYRALATRTNDFPVARVPQSPAADVLLALSKYNATIEELRRAAGLPDSRFPLEYDADNPAAMLLPHLAALKSCAQVLQLRALAELQNDQSDRALADVKLNLRLIESIRTEPILISHLVRIAMLTIALQPVWEGLAAHQWSDTQLVELDAELARLDFLSDYKLAMRGELVLFQGGIFDFLRRHPEQLANLSDSSSSDSPPSGLAAVRLVPRGWLYQNQLHCARPMLEWYLPLADMQRRVLSPSAARQADAAVTADTQHFTPYNLIERLLLPALGAAARKFAGGQATVDLARTAIALERYRIAQGEYPEKLGMLAPPFMGQLPHDVVNGQPLNYRRSTNGQFVLYSVGWNETDDDGEVGLNPSGTVDIRNGDWVWRYPAK